MKNIIYFIIFLLFAGYSPLIAQIGGKVVDSKTKEPIIGADVQVVGTAIGNVTDENGNFTIATAEKSAEVEISYLGYVTQKLTLTADNSPVIELKENAKELDEVVVIGYGVQKKSDLTGAVASVKAGDIQKIPTSTFAQALQGQAAGVEVVRNGGSPGSDASIRIRGVGTINNSEPLYVVDGLPLDNITFLSPDDISSIEILKDAASAAIYGSRAANGVVLVTTKKGQESARPLISFSGYYGGQNITKGAGILSKDQYPYFSDYVRNLNAITDPTGATPFPPSPVQPNWTLRQSAIDLVNQGANYWDYIIRSNSPTYKANLSVSGGTKDFNYYVSGGIYHDDGIIQESNYDRKNLNLKINTKIVKNLTLGTNLSYTREDKSNIAQNNTGIVQTAITISPLTSIKDPSNGNLTGNTPIELLNRLSYNSWTNTLLGQISLDWDIVKGLKFTTRAGESIVSADYDQYQQNGYNIQNVIGVGTFNSAVHRNPVNSNHFNWDNILNYVNSFGKNNLNVMIGQSAESATKQNYVIQGSAYGGYGENIDAMNFAQYLLNTSETTEGWSVLSFLGRLSYDYDSKYLLQVNFREDGSSRFASAHRWGAFPSVSLGWKLSGEKFMQNVRWISFLKLRAGWGTLGNNNIGNFTYLSLVGVPGNYIYGTGVPTLNPAFSIGQFGNPNIVWEKTISQDIGLDLNLFNNRFTSSFDFFIKNTSDMLNAIPIPYMTGIANPPMQNTSSVRNTGGEIQAAWQDKIGNFRYSLGGNISYIKNRVTALGGQENPIWGGNLGAPTPLGYVTRTIVGAPIGAFYGYKTNGLLKDNDFDAKGNVIVPVFTSTTQKFQPGDMKFVDVNGDGIIDSNDETYLGTPLPDLYYGFNLNFGYKDFDLSLFFQGVAGNKIYNTMKLFKYSDIQNNGVWSTNYGNVASDYFSKVYRPATATGMFRDYFGANPNGTVPVPENNPTIDALNFSNSDFYLEDGSYLRLKNIQLSYTLPKKICQRTKVINSCTAYITISNLLTVTKYTGLDPEVGSLNAPGNGNLSNGIDLGVYPQSRMYMIGASIDF